MIKNKKFVFILAIFILGAVFLAGCGVGAGEETEQEGEAGVTDTAGPAGEEKAVGEEEAVPADEEEAAEAQATTTTSGTLKAVDAAARTVTIATESDGELVLEVTDKSKILVDESFVTYVQLVNKIGSEVIVEYYDGTKVVTAVSIQD
ncbi:MAG: hypothetical protein HPY66_1093 [Firmicutes bacterium]|nr:hypothetical protein [Bacillota bacterium]MDI6706298.1 hypothetical protein [Bacillota bacterium]